MKKLIILSIILFTIQFLMPICGQSGQNPDLVIQIGHSGAVKSAIFSSDGKLVVSNGPDGIIIWHSSTGKELRRIQGLFSAVDFSPDSKTIAAARMSGEYLKENDKTYFSVEIVDVMNGRLLKQFPTHTEKLNSIKYSPDGKLVLTASDDKTAILWESASGNLRQSFIGHKTAIRKVVFSPDGKYIATAGGERDYESEPASIVDSTARIWNINTGKEVQKFIHEDKDNDRFDGIGDVAFSSNGEFLITSANPDYESPGDDTAKTIRVWNLKDEKLQQKFFGRGTIFSTGKYLFANISETSPGDSTEGVEIIDLSNMKIITIIKDFNLESKIADISLSSDEKYALVATETDISGGSSLWEFGENSLSKFDVMSGRKVMKFEGKGSLKGFYSRNTSYIKPLNDDSVLIGNYLWNFRNGTQTSLENVNYNNLGKGDVYRSALRVISRDGKLLAMDYALRSNSEEESPEFGIQIWDAETGQQIQNLKQISGFSAWFTPDNSHLLIEYFGGIELWNVKNGRKVWSKEISDDRTNFLIKNLRQDNGLSALSPDGKFILVRESEDVLVLMETVSGKVIWRRKLSLSLNLPGVFFSSNGLLYIVPVIEGTENNYKEFTGFFDIQTHKETARVEKELLVSNNPNLFYSFNSKVNELIDKNTGKVVAELPFNPNDPNFGWGRDDANGFSGNNPFFLASTSTGLSFYNTASGKKVRDFIVNDFQDAIFYKLDELVLIASLNGSTRVWNRATGEELCRLISFDDGTWVVSTPDGRFDTNNLEAIDGLHWIVPDDPLNPLSVEIFMRDYYEPKLLTRTLNGEKLPPIRNLSSLNRTQPKIEIKEIKKHILSDTVEITVETENMTSEFQKDANKKALNSGVFDLRLFRDGQLVGSSTTDTNLQKTFRTYKDFDEELKVWREANKVDLNGGKKTFSFQVKMPNNAGNKPIEFSAYAFNNDRVKSETARKTFTVPAKNADVQTKARKAYVIAFGVNKYENAEWNLQFAANDARAMREIVAAKLRGRKEFAETIEIPLISDDETANGKTIEKRDATKGNVKTTLDLLSGKNVSAESLRSLEKAVGAETLAKIKQANPDDMVLLSFSSHGYADRNGIFYILPTDIGTSGAKKVTDELLRNSISSDELSLWLRDVDAGEIVMIVDACHAASAVEGKDFKPAPMGSRGLGQLAFDKGMKILTATQAANVAIESGGTIGHGLLTFALLREGLDRNAADFKAKDKTINLKEWLEFGEFCVPRLYEDLAKGNLKSINRGSEVIDLGGNNKDQISLQTPTLFDFTRKNQEMILAQMP